MIILFVGSNPSIKNLNPNIAFSGNPSRKKLDQWITYLQINNYLIINVLDEVTNKNAPLTKRQIKNSITTLQKKINELKFDKIVALGNTASTALKLLKLEHYKLPHPSGKNFKLNDKEYLENELKKCKEYLNANS